MNVVNWSGRRFSAYARRLIKAAVRVARRNPRQLLWVPPVTAVRARVSGALRPTVAPLSNAVAQRVGPRVSVHQDLIAYPLVPGRDREFRGGLVDGRSHRLIEEAVQVSYHSWEQEEPTDAGPPLQAARLPELRVPVLYGGILFNHFGHFMLESLGRLWAYDHVHDLDPYIAFYPAWGRVDYLSRRNFAHQVLTGLGIPMRRILLLTRPVRIREMMVPESLYGYDECRDPADEFVDYVRRFVFPRSMPQELAGAKKVYVSRSGLPERAGRPIGEKLFEGYLRSQGYRIFHPERYPLYQQLTVYNASEELVFCDGAALHACILLPDLQARVAVICRRRDPRWDPREIVDQFRGYGKDVTWIDAVRYQYQFGLESWDARSFVDWFEVSVRLKDCGFTTEAFDAARTVGLGEVAAVEVRDYIGSIYRDPDVVRYLMKLKQ